MAAPLMGIVAAILIGVPGYLYLEWRCRNARKMGLGFIDDELHKDDQIEERTYPSWHWLSGLVPLIVVVLMLNVLPGVLAKAGIVEWSSN